jgi:glycosyltransferase involved in cell wall biosynthesis
MPGEASHLKSADDKDEVLNTRVSIITVNYNNKQGLSNTLESVLAQKTPPFEYLIIDGGSEDGSAELIKKNAVRFSYWKSEKDGGIYNAMNKGIANAKGDYLLFLNSGDCLCEANILEKCQALMQKSQGADIYYGDMFVVNNKENPETVHWTHPAKIDLQFLKVETLSHQASFIKSSLFKEFGFYPETYRIASDYWLWLKSLLNNKTLKYLDIPIAEYDFSGVSSQNRLLYKGEKEQIWKDLVPPCIQELISENELYKKLTEYKLVKAAIQLNKKYQGLKQIIGHV